MYAFYLSRLSGTASVAVFYHVNGQLQRAYSRLIETSVCHKKTQFYHNQISLSTDLIINSTGHYFLIQAFKALYLVIILTCQCMYSIVKCTGHHPGVVYPLFKPYWFYSDVHYFYAAADDDNESVTGIKCVYLMFHTHESSLQHMFTYIKDYPYKCL